MLTYLKHQDAQMLPTPARLQKKKHNKEEQRQLTVFFYITPNCCSMVVPSSADKRKYAEWCWGKILWGKKINLMLSYLHKLKVMSVFLCLKKEKKWSSSLPEVGIMFVQWMCGNESHEGVWGRSWEGVWCLWHIKMEIRLCSVKWIQWLFQWRQWMPHSSVHIEVTALMV